jgi:hypothetical protein
MSYFHRLDYDRVNAFMIVKSEKTLIENPIVIID